MKPDRSKESQAWNDLVRRFQRELLEHVDDLELAIERLVESVWDEEHRAKAEELALALSDRSRLYGFDEVASLARAVWSLVRLSLEEVISLQPALRAKLHELLDLLKDVALESSNRRIA